MATEFTQVALFPIPNVVAFPGTVVPLHVFEPRYRTMINDAVNLDRMIGVCHTKKEISAAPSDQSVEDALKSNQATYEPYRVFSAGPCEIIETTDDGRIYANIKMARRFELMSEVQTLPYRIVSCCELLDKEDATTESDLFQESITDIVLNMVGKKNPALTDILSGRKWSNLPADEFSFKVFQFLQFDPDTMQSILESRSPLDRLRVIEEILVEVANRRD